MATYYPEFNDSPPDSYYSEEWERRCEELDQESLDELTNLFEMIDAIGEERHLARPIIAESISHLMSALDRTNPVEGSLMHLFEKADRVLRMSIKADEHMIRIEADHYRFTPHGRHFSGA